MLRLEKGLTPFGLLSLLIATPACHQEARPSKITTLPVDAGRAKVTADAGRPVALPPSGQLADASVSFPADWCARAGATESERTVTLAEAAQTFGNAQYGDCETRGLTDGLTRPELLGWLNYLISYTIAMAGCPPVFEPIPDGIRAFGPGNTPAVGGERPKLGEDDVERLIAYYVSAFGDALGLDPPERAAVRDYLLAEAQDDLDPTASRVLSVCRADAGP